MNAESLQHLLATLLETAQAIAADRADPMHDAVRVAAEIESVTTGGAGGLTITTSDGRHLRVTIAE